MIDQAEKWLSEEGARFVLGQGADYSLADVMFTTALVRLKMHSRFFKENVLGRPFVKRYWEHVQKRPSYKAANLNTPPSIGTFTTIILIALLVAVLSLPIGAITKYLIIKKALGYHRTFKLWVITVYFFVLLVVILVFIFFAKVRDGKERYKKHIRDIGIVH